MAGLTDHVKQHDQPALRRLEGSQPREASPPGEDALGSGARLKLAPKPPAVYSYGVQAHERWGLE